MEKQLNGRHPDIPAEDQNLVINVGFAERFASFTRLDTDKGPRWLEQSPPVHSADQQVPLHREPRTIDQLPIVAGSGFQFLSFLTKFCNQLTNENEAAKAANGTVLWSINLMKQGTYACVVGILVGEEFTTMMQQQHVDPAVACASAMLAMVGFDPAMTHRELFPHRYLITP